MRRKRKHRGWHRRKRQALGNTLADVRPGVQVRIVDMDGLTGPSRLRLLALGLWPGRCVKVIRHSPVTMVRAEHSELALETETARGIRVEADILPKLDSDPS